MIVVIRRSVLAGVASVLALASTSPVQTIAMPAADSQCVGYFHEARLRKLHLVRPDLISYPVSFDVVC